MANLARANPNTTIVFLKASVSVFSDLLCNRNAVDNSLA